MESSGLLVNLVIALAAALAGAIIAARFRHSVILGYIVAGIAIGPYTPGFVGDIATVEALAQIGVILLMFAIGVQFSLRELIRSGRVAAFGATFQVLLVIAIGYLASRVLDWTTLEGLFFGAVISNSSSTVLTKVLGDRGELDTPHGRLALSWSTVQDLGTVILIVVLTALSTDGDNLALSLVVDVGKAGLFLVLLVPLGLKILPWFFSWIAALRNREVFVLSVAAAALGLAYSASLFGLSLALGAFVAGIVVGESDLSHQILGDVLPLRDIFSGLFFVSIGMLVDPWFVIHNLPLVALTVILIMLVKGLVIAAIAALLGVVARTALLGGAILAQSAEFSFLLAQVGASLGVLSPRVFSLMLAGAAASIVLVPSAYRATIPLAANIDLRFGSWRRNQDDAASETIPDVGHVIVCGYGRVGRMVCSVLEGHARYAVIEEDPRLIPWMRAEEATTVQGNAAIPAVLERAGLASARALIVAVANPVAARQVTDYVVQHHPELPIIVRTHNEEERRFLLDRGAEEAVLGEHELALEMGHHALEVVGVDHDEAISLVDRIRRQAGGRNQERHAPWASNRSTP